MTTKNNEMFPMLVGDVGGTNARFGLLPGRGARPRCVVTYRCAEFPGIVDALKHYLSRIDAARPRYGAIAVATAVTGDRIRMTNHVWQFSVEETRRILKLEQLKVVNDFTALALALPFLTPEEKVQIGGGEAVPGTAVALLGPGTGLGVSGLVPAGERWIPLQGEGGHVTFAPDSEREFEIARILRQRHGHVSAERLLSGPGLVNLYRAYAVLQGVEASSFTPADVTSRALAGECSLCEAALESFCAILGTTAGNLALTLGARGGIYVGGGIVPRLGEYFAASPFRQRFEQKGRFSDYLAAIPCWVIVAKYPALIGAADFLLQQQSEMVSG